jgi:hypothetical protein
MSNKKKIEGSNGLEDTKLSESQKRSIAESDAKAHADAKAAILHNKQHMSERVKF